jgi:hypothetical protein
MANIIVTQEKQEDAVIWNLRRKIDSIYDKITITIGFKRGSLISEWRVLAKMYNTLVNAERDNQRDEQMYDINFDFNQ